MWILKGSVLGTGLFLVGTFFFLIAVVRPFRSNTAIGLSVITGLTIHNPLFWAAFAASVGDRVRDCGFVARQGVDSLERT